MQPCPPRRPALTLVELIVVVVVILILLALAVYFVPRLQDQDKAASGARLVFGWLQQARSQALKTQRPYGVRIMSPTDGTKFSRAMQYIEEPDFFMVPATVPGDYFRPIVTDKDTVTLAGPGPADFTGGFAVSQPEAWPVQVGDYLIVNPVGVPRLIKTVQPARLIVEPAFPPTGPDHHTAPTDDYKIFRSPRVAGGEPLNLPVDVAIDLNHRASIFHTDILFAPGGHVIGQAAASDKIILWVRDITLPSQLDGEPQLVCIYPHSGAIAVVPVNPTGDPYTFTSR